MAVWNELTDYVGGALCSAGAAFAIAAFLPKALLVPVGAALVPLGWLLIIWSRPWRGV